MSSAVVLVVGGGGREHALAWKLAQSPCVGEVLVTPGNAGTADQGGKVSNIACDVSDHAAVVSLCRQRAVSLVVVGPEDPLANGIADTLQQEGIACFGPSAAAAQIEASKDFAKAFMTRHGIPTARYASFTNSSDACDFINSAPYPALVVKASGLAAGKGVVVASDRVEACAASTRMLDGGAMGGAGTTVVVEELLEGTEVSVLAFCDGQRVVVLPPAQDHKRLLDGDAGPNTGGMGAYCPCPLVSASDLETIKTDVLQRAVDGLRQEGTPYVGVLYAGLMLTASGPKTLEFNCRFGDPETQVLLPLLESDLYRAMTRCVEGRLAKDDVVFATDKVAVAVVTVSEGYPGSYPKGRPITGLSRVLPPCLVFHAGTRQPLCAGVETSGGRVLAIVAVTASLAAAARAAYTAVKAVTYDGMFYRKDIAARAMKATGGGGDGKSAGLTYACAGVDISAGDALVSRISPLAAATARPGCSPDLGGFGGVFDLAAAGVTGSDTLLVAGTDGVGTKVKIAQALSVHDTIGIDLVAMCVNDVLCHGAAPLLFLDYFACGRLDVTTATSVVAGVAEGCKQAGCALLGGETAEMPGVYAAGEYDVAGFTVGAVTRDRYLPRTDHIVAGDCLIGVASSGVHSNGFSLLRKVVEVAAGGDWTRPCPWDSNSSIGGAVLEPTRIYVKSVLPVLQTGKVKALCHITGGGLPGNVPRVLPSKMAAVMAADKWKIPPVFGWIAHEGGVCAAEMAATFNLGVGLVLVVAASDCDAVLEQLSGAGEAAWAVGRVTERGGAGDAGERVVISGLEEQLQKAYTPPAPATGVTNGQSIVNGTSAPPVTKGRPEKKRVAVLISGSGTNLQALIDSTQAADSAAEICLVISNKPGVKGLSRAEAAGIETKVIEHQGFSDRAAFDAALHDALMAADAHLVCLAGFMRILTGDFVSRWSGRMINIHPSLLPAFKGAHAQKQAIESGVRVSGCTAHFVSAGVDDGAVIAQAAVPVLPTDTEASLAARILQQEHQVFPAALALVTSGRVVLEDGRAVWRTEQ